MHVYLAPHHRSSVAVVLVSVSEMVSCVIRPDPTKKPKSELSLAPIFIIIVSISLPPPQYQYSNELKMDHNKKYYYKQQ